MKNISIMYIVFIILSWSSISWSNIWKIADDTDNAIEEMNSNLTLYTAYPNPAEDMVTINFNMINTDQVDIQIFNINGEMVYNYNDRMNFGQNRVVINTQEFSNGTYYYSVQTANSVLTSKFIIQK